MSKQNLPTGWDEEKINLVLAHCDQQSEDQAFAEDEAGVDPSETVMTVPHDLVPQVRELIAKHHE